jgi:hypothetical protein
VRRLGVGALALVLLFVPVAAAQAKPGPKQVVHGNVHTPTAGACSVAAHRADVGYRFDVRPSSWSRTFALTAARPAALEIVFVGRDGAVSELGHRGVVPKWARSAYVCLTAGAPTRFTYTAG